MERHSERKLAGMTEREFWQRAFLTYACNYLPDVAATYADAAVREMRERESKRHRFDPDKSPKENDHAP